MRPQRFCHMTFRCFPADLICGVHLSVYSSESQVHVSERETCTWLFFDQKLVQDEPLIKHRSWFQISAQKHSETTGELRCRAVTSFNSAKDQTTDRAQIQRTQKQLNSVRWMIDGLTALRSWQGLLDKYSWSSCERFVRVYLQIHQSTHWKRATGRVKLRKYRSYRMNDAIISMKRLQTHKQHTGHVSEDSVEILVQTPTGMSQQPTHELSLCP